MNRMAALTALVLMIAFAGRAQSPSARFSVSGVVQDQAGAAIVGARVELAAANTTGVQSTTTDQSGRFEFKRIASGAYRLQVSSPGFESTNLDSASHNAIQMRASGSCGDDIHLIKGGVNIPDLSRRGYNNNLNSAGTFYFSTLADYVQGRPFSFVQQQGNGHIGLLVVLASIPSVTLAQQLSADKVPPVVRQAYEAKFSGVRRVEWKIKSDHNYEAEFKRNGVEVAAKFDADGKWLETETTIARAKLPADVRATISKKFGGYKVIETQSVERFDQKLLLYEVHLENVKEVLKTLFEENGTLLSQSSKPKKRA